MKLVSHIAGFCIGLVMLAGCKVTSTVPQDDYLYKSATMINVDSADESVVSAADKKLLYPRNSRLFGIPYKLILYNMAGKPATNRGGFKNLIRKLGEPPLLLSQIDTVVTAAQLKQHFFGAGYFHPQVTSQTVRAGKTASLQYSVRAGKRYKAGEVIYPPDSSQLIMALKSISDSTLLHKGDYIKLDLLAKERERVNESLKNQGYFLFNPDIISYEADTLPGGSNDFRVQIRPGTPKKVMLPWQINTVAVFNGDPASPDSVGHTLDFSASATKTSQTVAGYKMRLYRDAVLLKPGDIYNKQLHFLSIQRLINLETFQFVKFSFVQQPTDSIHYLTTNLYATAQKKYHVKFEFSAGAKGNNYLGTKLTSGVINSNLFGGAEKLELQIQGGADFQFGGNGRGSNSINFGGNLSLSLPRLIPRLGISGGQNPRLPETRITVGSNYYKIPKLFAINLLGSTLEYKFRSNVRTEHNLTPIDIGVFKLSNSSPLLDSALAFVPVLRETFRSQLILSSAYQLWVNRAAKPGRILQGGGGMKVKSSGNLLGLLAGIGRKSSNERKLLGLPVAQFLKLEGELRGYFKINRDNTFAVRTMVGAGLAYGNSETLPYTEQYFIGGSNSLRAFRPGIVGPGSYQVPNRALRNIQYGDLKLEMNSEWRYSINPTVKFALFADAGNVWLRKEDPAKPGSDLRHFLPEIALGGGAGLRLDFSLLILRLDAAFPFRKPWNEAGQRWVFNEFDPFSKSWRKNDLVLNIGIGYPF